jgi:hypothetical protein
LVSSSNADAVERAMTLSDPNLGEYQVFRAGGRQILNFVVAGLFLPVAFVVALFVTAPKNLPLSPYDAYLTPAPDYGALVIPVLGFGIWTGLFFAGAIWESLLRLTVGERGFRYWRPTGAVEVPWSNVDSIQLLTRLGGRYHNRISTWVVVALREPIGGSSNVNMGPNLVLAASWGEINEAMNARLEAAGARETSRNGGTRTDSDDTHIFHYGAMGTVVMFVIGLVPIGFVVWALIGHLQGPPSTSVWAYSTWQDPLPPSGAPWAIGFLLVGAFFCFLALCASQARLVVDDRGFYLWRPNGSIEAGWDQVAEIECTPPRSFGSEPRVTIRMLGHDNQPGTAVSLNGLFSSFAAGNQVMWQTMQAALDRYRGGGDAA